MALLKYVGNSPYGTTITLSDLRTIVTVTKSQPHSVDISDDATRRYYKSLASADILLEVEEVETESTVQEEQIEVDVEAKVVEETTTESTTVEDSVSEEVTELSDEEVVEKLMAMNDEEFSSLLQRLDHKSKKRNRSAIAWELVSKFSNSILV